MRGLRRGLEAAIPLVGTGVVLAAVLFIPDNLTLQLVVVVGGILLVEAGVWRLTNPFLPSERRNEALREEVDGFLDLVRQLDRAAVAARREGSSEAERRAEVVHDEMRAALERMREVAGRRTERREIP